jgi:hypothetical protein
MNISAEEYGFISGKNNLTIPIHEKKIFLLGSSHVGALNSTYIEQHLKENGFDYKVYKFSEPGDKPTLRVKLINYLVKEQPDLIVYGIGFRDFQNTQMMEGHYINFIPDRQPDPILPDIREHIWNIMEDNLGNFFKILSNPKLITLNILNDYIGENHFPIPNHVLIKLWNKKLDLQEVYPEVGEGNMKNLKFWACYGWKEQPTLSALNPYLVGSQFNDGLISIKEMLYTVWICRPDLQKTYPEVSQGNYTNLLEWAKDIGWKEEPRLFGLDLNQSSSKSSLNASKSKVGNSTKTQQWYSIFPIATDSALRDEANQSPFSGFDPNYMKSSIKALDKIIKNLKENDIKVVIFTTPHQRYYLDTVTETDQKVFHSIFEQLSNKFNIKVYYLDSKYADISIWYNISHVSRNNTVVIYNDDIVKMIMENINR